MEALNTRLFIYAIRIFLGIGKRMANEDLTDESVAGEWMTDDSQPDFRPLWNVSTRRAEELRVRAIYYGTGKPKLAARSSRMEEGASGATAERQSEPKGPGGTRKPGAV